MLWVGVATFVGAFTVGFFVGNSPAYQPDLPSNLMTIEGVTHLQITAPFLEQGYRNRVIGEVYGLHVRYMFVAIALGMISFGVAPLIMMPLMVAALGYGTAILSANGIPIAPIWAAAIPHLLFNVPVLILMTTAAFRIGALVTKLPPGLTIGQAWSQALGDALKLGVFVAVPVLTLTYVIELLVLSPLVRAVVG